MGERRRFERHPVKVAISVSTLARRHRVGVTRDLSASGLMFHSVSPFELGERVRLEFRAPRVGQASTMGLVVRTVHDPDGASPFRYVTAVRFDAPLFELPLGP